MKECDLMHRLVSRLYAKFAEDSRNHMDDWLITFLPEDDVNEDAAHEHSPLYEQEESNKFHGRRLFGQQAQTLDRLYNMWLALSSPPSVIESSDLTLHWQQELIKVKLLYDINIESNNFTCSWHWWNFGMIVSSAGSAKLHKLSTGLELLLLIQRPPLDSNCWFSLSSKGKTLTNWNLFACLWFWMSKACEISLLQYDEVMYPGRRFNLTMSEAFAIQKNYPVAIFSTLIEKIRVCCNLFLTSPTSGSIVELRANGCAVDYLNEGIPCDVRSIPEEEVEPMVEKFQAYLDAPLDRTRILEDVIRLVENISEDKVIMDAMFVKVVEDCKVTQHTILNEAFRKGSVFAYFEELKDKRKSLVPLFK
jgi:hypothetical protein